MFVSTLRLIVTALGTVNAAGVVHSIDVGNGGIKFAPNSLTAAVGDQLQFHFYTGTGAHSVVSSTFESPCIPATNAFFSGYVAGTSSGSIIFTTNVTSTDPIWFYCSLSTHCQGGMIGVVNPPTGKSAADYANAAKSAAKASAPASVQGGVLATAATTTVRSSGISTPGVSVATTLPSLSGNATAKGTVTSTGSGASVSSSATTSAGSTAATTKASAAGRSGDLSVVLSLGVFAAGLVALMA